MSRQSQAHLVGSMHLADAEAVFKTVSEQCGDAVTRIPDGETGPRAGWVFSMIPRFEVTPGLEAVGKNSVGYLEFPEFGLGDGVEPDDVRFDLGYDTIGIASWPLFKRLKQEGVIGKDAKFMIAIPTAMAVLGCFIQEKDRPTLYAPYIARLKTEIEQIVKTIPAQELAIQWDVAAEFGLMEGALGEHSLTDEFIIESVVATAALVPPEVDMGYHLCYGGAPPEPGAKGQHFKEPEDAALLTRVANAISEGASRPLNFIHMPVPIERDDDAYFEPLENLQLRPETDLYLGLLHEEDGIDGAQRRIATASKHVKGPFGVGTECGMNNEATDRIPALLKLHRDVRVPS